MAQTTALRQWAAVLGALPVAARSIAAPHRMPAAPGGLTWLSAPGTQVVRGTPLCAPRAGGPALAPGAGAELDSMGHAVAARDGRLVAERHGDTAEVRVLPLRVHPGNWGPGAGRTAWAGDLEIHGRVEGPANLTADGRVHVTSGVRGATVCAGDGLTVRGTCMQAVLQCGGPAGAVPRLRPLVSHLAEDLRRLERAAVAARVTDVAHVVTGPGPGPTVALLASRRFSGAVDDLEDLLDMLSGAPNEVAAALAPVWVALHGALVGGRLDRLAQLGDWADELEAAAGGLVPSERVPVPPPVELFHLAHTEVTTDGSLYITGPGAEQSALRAGGRADVAGLLRGGWLEAGGDVRLGQAAGTVVMVPAGATISARQVMPCTVFAVGTRAHRFDAPVRDVRVRLGPGGDLSVQCEPARSVLQPDQA